MSAAVILELPKGRSLIRLEVRHIGGRVVVTFRKCHRAGSAWKPTRTAIAFPLEAFPALHRALRGLRGWRQAGKRLRRS